VVVGIASTLGKGYAHYQETGSGHRHDLISFSMRIIF